MKILALAGASMLRVGALLVLLLVAGVSPSRGVADEPKDAPANAEQKLTEPTAEQVAALEKLMSGATLVGHFTVTGVEPKGDLPKERYELGEVKRLESGDWLIQSRIRYGEHDVTLPLTLPIRWAGDTPVICVDDMSFPGLGTYTARVMIYRGHYAGFWTGKDHGGHLFGVVEAAKAKAHAVCRHEPLP